METVNYINRWCTVSVIKKTLNYLVNATVNFVFNVALLLLLIYSLLLWVILLFSPTRLGKQESTVYRKGYPFLYCFINSIIRRLLLCHISILYFSCFQAMIVLLFVGHSEIGRIIVKRILAKTFVMMWSGSMIIMFSFVAKGRLHSVGSVKNNPCEPEKFHVFFWKKHTTKNQFFPNIYQNVPVGRKDVKSTKHILK
jgi:hypothetical protein